MPYISFAFSSSQQHWLHDVLKNEPPKCSFGLLERFIGSFSFSFFFFNLCSNFKHGHKDYVFILLHKGSEQVFKLTEHFMWYLATKKETLSAQNSQEHQLAKFMARCGKITSTLSTFADFSLCWHFWCPESCCAHILCCWCQRTLSVFTCQDEENLLQCPKDLTPVKYVHLTQALWSMALKS